MLAFLEDIAAEMMLLIRDDEAKFRMTFFQTSLPVDIGTLQASGPHLRYQPVRAWRARSGVTTAVQVRICED
jgi:hypothetical protein